mgnify:CR=1 FL=1
MKYLVIAVTKNDDTALYTTNFLVHAESLDRANDKVSDYFNCYSTAELTKTTIEEFKEEHKGLQPIVLN